MKTRHLLCIILLLIIVACQPTPAEEFITHKDLDAMIAAVSSEEHEAAILSDMEDRTFVFSYGSETDALHISADAPIVLPDTKNIPVMRIKRHEWAEEDISACFDALCPGQILIEKDSFPKAYYQKTLDELLALLAEGNLDKYESQEELEQAIREQMQLVERAPSLPQAVPANFSFQIENFDGELVKMGDWFTTKDGSTISWIDAFGSAIQTRIVFERDLQSSAGYRQYLMDTQEYIAMRYSNDGVSLQAPSISQDDAFAVAEAAVNKIAPFMACSATRLAPVHTMETEDGWKCSYEFVFTREISGFNALYTNTLLAMPPTLSDVAAPSWWYESIRCFVDEEGIAYLIWDSPYDILESIETHGRILPFDDICKTFEKMMPVQYAVISDEQYVKIDINKVCLGLCRITERDDTSKGILIPAWFFFGTRSITSEGKTFTYGNDGYESILTINAIDGSVIDLSKGY